MLTSPLSRSDDAELRPSGYESLKRHTTQSHHATHNTMHQTRSRQSYVWLCHASTHDNVTFNSPCLCMNANWQGATDSSYAPRAARQLANIRLVRAKTARTKRRSRVKTLKPVHKVA